MEYQRLFVSLTGSLLLLFASAMLPSNLIAQTSETHSKDEVRQSSCLKQGYDSPDASANAGSQTGPARLSLAPIVGPQPTPEEARKLFEKGACKGYAPSQVNLGVLYAYGWGVPQNMGTALYWIGLAADQGNVQALGNMGIFYRSGWGVPQDQVKAFRYFQAAAQAGDLGGMTNLGYAYDQGLGVAKNSVLAADWYRKASDRGDATGQNNLADLYLRGEGVSQDDQAAFELFSKAANQGNTAAAIKLGYMYMTGRATAKDPETAYAWIKFATLAGDDRGHEYLRPLSAKLTAAQKKQAEECAESLRHLHAASGVQQASMRP